MRNLEVLKQFEHAGRPCLILRGPIGNPCAYVGIPLTHELASSHYDDVSIDCHGGLTYGCSGDGDCRPKEYYWFGWDYSHSGDYCDYSVPSVSPRDGKKWTLEEVEAETRNVAEQFAKLMTVPESKL